MTGKITLTSTPEILIIMSSEPKPENNAVAQNWAGTKAGAAVAYTVIGIEASPLPINEGLRVAAGAWGYHVSQGNSVAAAMFAGFATAAIEGGAALAAADLLDTFRGRRATQYVREKMQRVGIRDGLKTNLAIDTSIALLGGSAVVTAVKHQQDPTRTRSKNRKYGLASAGGLSVLTTAETYAVANGFEHPNPLAIAMGALAVGALAGAAKWAKSRILHNESARFSVATGETPHLLKPTTEAVREALDDPRTISIEISGDRLPVVVPIDLSRWYNVPYLRKHFGTAKLYSYMYPDLTDDSSKRKIYECIRQIVQDGGVILYGVERKDGAIYGDLAEELKVAGVVHTRWSTAPEGQERCLYQYDGIFVPGKIGGRLDEFRSTQPIHQVYGQAVNSGKIKFDPLDGPAFAEVIQGQEADQLWKFYDASFKKLSNTHPILTGYSENDFRQMLADPTIAKLVYRQKGNIVTMAFLLNGLQRCDWLDAEYYAQKYPAATLTNNHWVLPGIVTDEKRRGERLSVPLLSLAAKVQAMTGSNAVISFECTEESMKYIPRIAQLAIRKSMAGRIKGGFNEVSRLEYYAIAK